MEADKCKNRSDMLEAMRYEDLTGVREAAGYVEVYKAPTW
jgi:hypothetical protein